MNFIKQNYQRSISCNNGFCYLQRHTKPPSMQHFEQPYDNGKKDDFDLWQLLKRVPCMRWPRPKGYRGSRVISAGPDATVLIRVINVYAGTTW